MQLSGDGAGGDAGEGACGWRLGIDGHPVAVPFDDVENPAAERLGDGCPGEHREEVAAAQGEDAEFYREHRSGVVDDFNELRHIRREFISILSVELAENILTLVAKRMCKLCRANPW